MIRATFRTDGYQIFDPDWRTIAIIGRGLDARGMIRDAIAEHVGCDPDDLEFEEEYDRDEWTGHELARCDGAVVARIVIP